MKHRSTESNVNIAILLLLAGILAIMFYWFIVLAFHLRPTRAHVDPHIRGTITRVLWQDGRVISIFVEGKIDPDTDYDAAGIGITPETRIFIEEQGYYPIVSSERLKRGMFVQISFVGAIQASYPPTATGGEIIILPLPEQ